ncbi:MAG: hypothetical protein V5A68_03955 [Candidatus Thermoplasmatota archaeon]
MDDLFDLKDKVAIVTGASRGLGKVIAVGLAQKELKLFCLMYWTVQIPPMKSKI